MTDDDNGAAAPLFLSYDGSDDAKHAIEVAGSLFAGREALVATVFQPLTVALSSYPMTVVPTLPSDVDRLDRELEQGARDTAAEGAELASSAGLDAEPVAIEAGPGPIWRAIVEAAAARSAGLVVMGPRGLSGLQSVVLGSVSHGVVQHASLPVLIVPRPGEGS